MVVTGRFTRYLIVRGCEMKWNLRNGSTISFVDAESDDRLRGCDWREYRVGFHGFMSFIWVLFKLNRAAKSNGVSSSIEITLPLRWWR